MSHDPKWVCDTTLSNGEDCGLPAATAFETDGLTLYTCQTHRNEMLVWVADTYGDFTFCVLETAA